MWGAIAQAGAQLQTAAASNIWSSMEAKKARKFTKKMMQHRHQWEVEDLKKAGLNPILSAGGTPSMGASPAANIHPMGFDLEKAIDAGVAAATAKDKIQTEKHETWRKGYEAENRRMEALIQRETLEYTKKQTAHAAASAYKAQVEADLLSTRMPGALHEATIDASAFGRATRWSKRVTDQIPPLGVGALIQRGSKGAAKKVKRRTTVSPRSRSSTFYEYE